MSGVRTRVLGPQLSGLCQPDGNVRNPPMGRRAIRAASVVRGCGRAQVQVYRNAEGAVSDPHQLYRRYAREPDNGAGVAEEDLPRLADLFFTTKDAGKGTGLGLAIVHNVVASHGGRIELSSAPGDGLRVVLRLPGVAGSGRKSPGVGAS